MIYLFCIVCIVMFAVLGCDLSFGVSNSNIIASFFYQFMHVSYVHLAINIISLLLMYKPIKTLYFLRFGEVREWRFMLPVYLGSVLSGVCASVSIPTVGASGMVFFLLGELLMLRPTKEQLLGYWSVVVAVILSIIFGNSNIALHIISFLFGMLFIIAKIAYVKCRIHTDE